jgi:hypothetical protein
LLDGRGTLLKMERRIGVAAIVPIWIAPTFTVAPSAIFHFSS